LRRRDGADYRTVWILFPAVLVLLVGVFLSSAPALALTPRVAVCGRVTSVDVVTPGGPIVRLGTQQPRHLATGVLPMLDQEICIFGVDVGTSNAPGIAGYGTAPVASIGCADAVIGTNAFFEMPGEALSALPNHATLVLPLSAPPGNGCIRIAVDGQGNPLAVVVPRATTASPAVSSATPRPSVASLPNTSASDDRGSLVLALVGFGALVAAAGVLGRRRSREIPS
jgi:hypothetical protein